MNVRLNNNILIFKFILSIIFLLIVSLFFSAQKILIVFFASILFFLIKVKYQKIAIINLLIFVLLLKIIILPFQLKIPEINPSNIQIYEKHFLYGVRNLNLTKEYLNGDLSLLEEKYKQKYFNINYKKINIFSDDLGFRNEILPNEADYILIGDSFLHQTNITQEKILNYILNNKKNIKTYNAGLGATDISHYLETIKFFKKNMKLRDKKYVMFIFQGNDFLDYKVDDNINYHKYIDNIFLHSYFNFKIFFNFYNTFKYFSQSLKSDKNFIKVHEYNVKDQKVLFKFDYIFNENYNTPSLNFIFQKYKKYLPDLIIYVPTKYEVYCDLINKNNCKNSNHFSILSTSKSLEKIKILDSTKFLKAKSKIFINSSNKLLYESDDTHLNELGVKVLSNFVYNNIKK